jgi:Na+/H+ antiporter NhaC
MKLPPFMEIENEPTSLPLQLMVRFIAVLMPVIVTVFVYTGVPNPPETSFQFTAFGVTSLPPETTIRGLLEATTPNE